MDVKRETEKQEERLMKLKTPKTGDKCDICKKSLKQWWQDSFDDKKGHRSCLMKRLGRSQGNTSKYKPEYCEMLIEYFSIAPYREVKTEVKGHTKDGGIYIKEVKTKLIPNPPPSFVGFGRKVGVSYMTLVTWRDQFSEFSYSYEQAKKLYENFWITNVTMNLYNSSFTQFVLKNRCGWKDKSEQTINHNRLEQMLEESWSEDSVSDDR